MDEVRYGVVGLNGVGATHLREVQANPHARLTAVVDVDRAAVDRAKVAHGVAGFTDHTEMLAAGVVDAVSVAVPHHLHHPIGLDVLRAGVHLYLEKPFANRLSEADELLDAAVAGGLQLAVGHQYRAHRSSQLIKDVLDSGEIGTPTRALWMWGELRPEAYYRRDPWRNSFRDAGGGVLTNQASHDLDLACWLLGRPVQVSAMVANAFHDVDIDDIASASVLFDNGAMTTFQFTINHPRGHSVRQIQGDRGVVVMPEVQSLTHDQDETVLVGTYDRPLATLVRDLQGKDEQPAVTWTSRGFARPPTPSRPHRLVRKVLRRAGLAHRLPAPPPYPPPVDGFQVSLRCFIDAVRGRGEPLVTGRSARTTVELLNAIYLSAFERRTVDLPLDPAEYDDLFARLSDGRTRVPRIGAGRGTSSGQSVPSSP